MFDHRLSLALLLLFVSSLLGCGGSNLPPPRLPDDDAPAPRAAAAQNQNAPAPPPAATREDKTEVNSQESSGSDERPLPSGGSLVSTDPKAAHRKAQSVANMGKIGQALAGYVQHNRGKYPPDGFNYRGSRTLSWRVAMLPFIGQEEFYERFELKENYGSPHNRRYIESIPAMFQSHPEVPTKTNYVLLTGPGTCFQMGRTTDVKKITDGLANTIIMVELNDDYEKVPHWTQAVDLSMDEFSLSALAVWDENGFLAMTAAGQVVQIRTDITMKDFNALTTIAGGEPLSAASLIRPVSDPLWDSGVTDAPPPHKPPGGVGNGLGVDDTNANMGTIRTISANSNGSGSSRAKPENVTNIPSEREQQQAMEVVKALFLTRYQQADNNTDKKEIAREMFRKSKELDGDLAGKYVMLTTAKRIALEVNDIETAGAALQSLMDTFEFDSYEMKVELLRKSSSLTQKSSFDTKILDEAKVLMKVAVQRDHYPVALDMANVALSAARRLNDKDEATELTRRLREIEKMAASYVQVKRELARVGGSTTADENVSETVGRYYCFLKGDWEQGLPYLSQAANPDLKRLAQRDIEAPVDAEMQLRLADGWWEQSKKAKSPDDEHLRQRAGHWYTNAVKNLPKGLPRLKAEIRIKELEQNDARG